MKRAPWYLVLGAMAGFAGVLGLHGRAATPVILGRPEHGGNGAAKPQQTSSPSRAHGGSLSAGAAASGPARSATGAIVQYGYGELAVKVTVRGNEITGVSVPVLRTAEPYSQQIAVQVLPMLRSEVLSAHSARINGVSGATYTVEAYGTSLQSALDKLHIR